MNNVDSIVRHYQQNRDLQQRIKQQDTEFSERLETLKLRWNDNAGATFYQRYDVALQDEVTRLQDKINSFMRTSADLIDGLMTVENVHESLTDEQLGRNNLSAQQQLVSKQVTALRGRVEAAHENIVDALKQANSLSALVPKP